MPRQQHSPQIFLRFSVICSGSDFNGWKKLLSGANLENAWQWELPVLVPLLRDHKIQPKPERLEKAFRMLIQAKEYVTAIGLLQDSISIGAQPASNIAPSDPHAIARVRTSVMIAFLRFTPNRLRCVRKSLVWRS